MHPILTETMTDTAQQQRLKAGIRKWKDRRNAVILGHNYQVPAIQEISDFTGDSLGLSRRAAETDADVIVFCGVHFMAETAAVLSPDKAVLLPEPEAGCPMADMITAPQLRELKARHPDATVVCYVNSSVEVKAESDLCCTSANAAAIVASVPSDTPVIFVPDKYLGAWAAEQTGRELILWEGYCPTHACITPDDIERARLEHPDALIMVHPECLTQVCRMADVVASTSGMCRTARETDVREIVVGTEKGLIYRMEMENPDKRFYHLSPAALCPNMKLNTLEKVLWSLQEMRHEVTVPPDIAERAETALRAMINSGG